MTPGKPLPYGDEFASAEAYVESLLNFATTSTLFQTLCGGVHILDFFTRDPSLYDSVLPQEWRSYFATLDTMQLLDVLMRDDLSTLRSLPSDRRPPASLLTYITSIRSHSLQRTYTPRKLKLSKLPRPVSVGMVPKKIHEVANFADYVDRLALDVEAQTGKRVTHFVDFGSGQNYLGRTLASPPYNRHIIAVEGREVNISGAKNMDILANLAEREVVMRNKKLYRQYLDGEITESGKTVKKEEGKEKTTRDPPGDPAENVADFRPYRDLATIYKPGEGKGSIQYVEQLLNSGDLSEVIPKIDVSEEDELVPSIDGLSLADGPQTCTNGINATCNGTTSAQPSDQSLITISIHSCGNLSHHGIRSLLLNPSVSSIAIVGCCYNLLTERLGPPTYKNPLLRPNLQPLNARVARESSSHDPHGYPMSERVATYGKDREGIRLNITARMMAVQAPMNWTEKESEGFFTRHYFRALLQKVFLDRGVVGASTPAGADGEVKIDQTDPVIIGSLRKSCYKDFTSYVRGAVEKLTKDSSSAQGARIKEKMGGMSDEEIGVYATEYERRKKELSVMWSLMAFSAGVVESLIVTDRWLYLREHEDVVGDAWVEAVFEYGLSPRNLVVVGVKR
ncbi:MAG: methyltransferase [Leuconostoc sp.]|nr:methyltransferase [Leuconostoc sp.]